MDESNSIKRESGYYWIRELEYTTWEPAWYSSIDSTWTLFENDGMRTDKDLLEIDETPITRNK